MLGPGKYDVECTAVRESTNAIGCMLIVFEGDKGTGFSCQIPHAIIEKIPAILRDVADQIEADAKQSIIHETSSQNPS